MPRVCILTDSTAQFTRSGFPGYDRVFVIPLGMTPGTSLTGNKSQIVVSPSPQDFLQYFIRLGRDFDEILVMVLSSQLSPTVENAQKACQLFSNHASVQVVDTQTTGIGLGMLVEAASKAANDGSTFLKIEALVRAAIRRIYMILCIPELTRLEDLGLLTPTQAIVGEILGMLPLFMVEGGRLTLHEKVRTPRHLLESFQEFMAEFKAPARIALLRGTSQTALKIHPLRQYARETFPNTPYSEHTFNNHLTALFGIQSIGLAIMEPA